MEQIRRGREESGHFGGGVRDVELWEISKGKEGGGIGFWDQKGGQVE